MDAFPFERRTIRNPTWRTRITRRRNAFEETALLVSANCDMRSEGDLRTTSIGESLTASCGRVQTTRTREESKCFRLIRLVVSVGT